MSYTAKTQTHLEQTWSCGFGDKNVQGKPQAPCDGLFYQIDRNYV